MPKKRERHKIIINVQPDGYALLKEQADKLGMTVTGFSRMAAFKLAQEMAANEAG